MDITTLVSKRVAKQMANYDDYFAQTGLEAAPSPLRRLFIDQGAVRLKPNTLKVDRFETVVERILGISDEDLYDLAKQALLYQQRLPKGHLPLAALAFGDLLTVDTANSRVHLWIHDKDDEYQLRRLRRPLPTVAEHFDRLFDMIVPDTEEPPKRDPNAKSWTKPGFLEKLRAQGLLVGDKTRPPKDDEKK